MQRPVRWLHEQLPRWVTQGVVSPAQADAIRALYPEPKAGLPWGMLIFSGLGAVVIGLGIILLLAYNWDAIPKYGKLGLVFGALGCAHAGGLRWFAAPDWRKQLGEALGLVGTMLFGAGIWLVAQIYHIDEHFPNGFLFWGLGALALAWALPSVAQGTVAAVTLCIWGGSESLGFGTAMHWAPVLLAVGVGGLAWKARSPFLLAVVLAGLYFLLLTNAAQGHWTLTFPAALNLSVALAGLALIVKRGGAFGGSVRILRFFGWTGFLMVAYLLTFRELTEEVLLWHQQLAKDAGWLALVIYGWVPFALGILGWGWLAVRWARRRAGAGEVQSEQWLMPLTALLGQVLAVVSPLVSEGLLETNGVVVGGVFNLIVLAVAAMWMARGCREGELRSVILGSLVLVALVIARYFDLFESLALRGLVFVVVGGVLFAEGFFYRRARQRVVAERQEGQP